jgi:hypothetical protein
MKFWIVNYHHIHGNDAWPVWDNEPSLEAEAAKLDDFEPDREFLSVHGPFEVPREAVSRSQWEEM